MSRVVELEKKLIQEEIENRNENSLNYFYCGAVVLRSSVCVCELNHVALIASLVW